MSKRVYNWGILGPGRIARRLAEGLKLLPNARRYAVASRSPERAESFRAEFGFDKAFGSYAEMLADPELDVVYVATTNNLHYEHTLLCLNAGKAVLCEKPFASNSAQVHRMLACAREKNVFLMEALCTRFLPNMLELKRQIEAGTIGEPVMLQCDFGFIMPFDPENRVYAPELGGGSVPDIGIYPVFTALYLFGPPVDIHVASIPAPTGTDCTTAVLLRHKGGQISMLASSFQVRLEEQARVYGHKGHLKIPRRFSRTDSLFFVDLHDHETPLPAGLVGNGFNYEAAEVMNCLDRGLIESPAMSHQFSVELIETLDKICEKARQQNRCP
ncbi:MAG: Gfo/Idh/MocA family oxidoreductase [Bacteroidales bacterium]|jgi:predicted dehydrogenase|nr:Gfo/Idh/MocA family oxidoreductase [Bacteroidales bacterium]